MRRLGRQTISAWRSGGELAPGTAIKLGCICVIDVKGCTLLNRMVLESSSFSSAGSVGAASQLAADKVLSLRQRYAGESLLHFDSPTPCDHPHIV